MEKRKIALITSTNDTDMLEDVVGGIKERLAGTGWDLHVFMCIPAFGLENPENFGNYNIFSLPRYEDYEGFIFWVNVVDAYEMILKYHSKIFKCGKPMVSLEREIEGIPTIVPDGYSAMYHMVEHLVKDHGCREINYVGGMPDHPDNVVRKKAYMDALTAHGIFVEERRIRDYRYIDTDGQDAYRDFKEIGIELPDAVVCANDAMALGYCQAAELDGKYPPEDFLITGFDNDENSRIFTPLISSIDKKARELGYLGCGALFKLINGEEVSSTILYEPELVLRGSCGCYSEEESEDLTMRQLRRMMYDRIKEERNFYDRISSTRQWLALATSEGMFYYYMNEIVRPYDIYGYCVCINQEVYYSTVPVEVTWKTGYSKEQCVTVGMYKNQPKEEVQIIKAKDLMPEYLKQQDEETHVYTFVAVQRLGANLGYVVMVDAEKLYKRGQLTSVMSAFHNAYTNLRNLENLRKINKRLDSVYIKDALTDMYNRFGYMRDGYAMHEKSKLYGKPLMVMFMDMDHLKEINDIHGHSAGDNALIMYSSVLKKCVGDQMIAVRYGGDEFLVIGPVENGAAAEEFKAKFEKELKELNDTSGLPYLIEASVGYVLTDPRSKRDLDTYVEEADSLMYSVKKRNRKQRQ